MHFSAYKDILKEISELPTVYFPCALILAQIPSECLGAAFKEQAAKSSYSPPHHCASLPAANQPKLPVRHLQILLRITLL